MKCNDSGDSDSTLFVFNIETKRILLEINDMMTFAEWYVQCTLYMQRIIKLYLFKKRLSKI